MPIFGIIASSNASPYWLTNIYPTDASLLDLNGNMAIDDDGNIYSPYVDDNGWGAVIKQDSAGNVIWITEISFPDVNNIITLSLGYHTAAVLVQYTHTYTGTSALASGRICLSPTDGSETFQIKHAPPTSGEMPCAPQVSADSSFNVYTTGQINTSNPFTAYLMKSNTGGVPTWCVTYRGPGTGGSNFNSFNDSALASSGNIYTCGGWSNSSGGTQGIIVKYNSSGTLQWQRTLTEPSVAAVDSNVYCYALEIDSSENVYVIAKATSSSIIYLLKYNSAGTLQWQRKITESIAMSHMKLITDSSGISYVTYVNATGMIIIKYDASGTIQFQRLFCLDGSNLDDYNGQRPRFLKPIIDSANNTFIIGVSVYNGFTGQMEAETVKFPSDGSRTGSILIEGADPMLYSTYSAATDATGTLTDAAATGSVTGTATISYTTPTFTVDPYASITNIRRGKL